MRAERMGQLLDDEVWDESLLVQLVPETLALLLRYVATAVVDKPGFVRRVSDIRDFQTRRDAMNVAQQFRQEGRQEGRQLGHLEGRQEGLREGTLASLREAIEEVLVLRFAEAPVRVHETLAACRDEAELRVLHRTAIQCPTLADFEKQL